MREDPKIIGFVFMLLSSLSMGFLGGWIGANSRFQSNLTGQNTKETRQVVLNESTIINELAKTVGPSVVSVNVVTEAVDNSLFGFGEVYQQEGAGTGIILSADGYIVTNRHVVPRGATKVSVTLSDGTELTDVEVVGRTPERDALDVAFLKIKDKKGKELVPAKIGDSSQVQVGDKVIAIGNALGQFQNTVTAGIISGYGRSIVAGDEVSAETLQNLFQTDTAINQGNSGGPLVNINGEVIGINTAVAGNAENIGFSIPINDVKGLIKSVLEQGKLLRPYLGVRYVSLTDDYAYQFNLDVKRGAYIAPARGSASVLPGSPAEKAGLQERDIIIKVNETKIDETNSLTSVLGRFAVGDKVKLTVLRDAREINLEAKLEAAPTD
jgi:serine protease Do